MIKCKKNVYNLGGSTSQKQWHMNVHSLFRDLDISAKKISRQITAGDSYGGPGVTPSTNICIYIYTLSETNSSHLKIDGWKISFLLRRLLGRCYISSREGISLYHDILWTYPSHPGCWFVTTTIILFIITFLLGEYLNPAILPVTTCYYIITIYFNSYVFVKPHTSPSPVTFLAMWR